MGCSLLCKQFALLLWKNFVLQIRRPIGTVFEIILPILAVVFIVGLRLSSLFPTNNRIFLTFEPDPLTVPDSAPLNLTSYSLYYTPTGAGEIIGRAVQLLGLDESRISVRGFETESLMVDELLMQDEAVFPGCFVHGAGVVFENLGSDVEYTIRLRHEVGSQNSWFTDLSGPSFGPAGARVNPNSYLAEGFLHLQNVIGQAIIENKTGQTLNLDVTVEQFPFPNYQTDVFLTTIGIILPLLLVMAFIYSAGILVKELVLEKETRIRETMLMMGLQQWILWSTWYLKQLLFMLFAIIIITILVKAGGVFRASNIILIFVYFLFFILSMISFGFLVSVWFNSSRVGLIVGFVAWYANYLPFLFLTPRFEDLPLGGKVGSCILSNTCMGLGVEVISRLEQRLVGLQFSNLFEPLSADDPFNMAWVLGMLLLDSVVYMIIAWYVNGVKPGTYGVPKPFYFPFLPSYWTGRPRRSRMSEAQSLVQDMTSGGYDPSAHEEVPGNLEVGISISNLTKIYDQSIFSKLLPKKKENRRAKAVNDLSLNMYKGQITALLGHNGAGKTTTMSILTGLYTPTSGSATISGYDILTNMDQIRQSLGICPQHNVLFDRLTVSEHLSFFLRLKGIFDRKRVRTEVDMMVEDLQLLDKRNIQSQRLSGGMKRKLSVAIALIGGSEVVILDEPTSGMDPYARRATWDLLNKYKKDRTMLLTTHFMDEADLLGDRIAIMAEGVLRCSGSSLFLKSRYGVGYHLTVVKGLSCVSSRVEQLVKSFVPTAEQVTDVAAELSFILPASSTPSFPDLFDKLEATKTELGVLSFGVSITTMEEVFMKVGEGTDETLDDRLRRAGTLSPTGTLSPNHPLSPAHANADAPAKIPHTSEAQDEVGESTGDGREMQVAKIDLMGEGEGDSPLPGQVPVTDAAPDDAEPEFRQPYSQGHIEEDQIQLQEEPSLHYNYVPNKGIILWFQQFIAMFLKRFHNFRRFYGAIVTQLILPLLFVLFSMITAVTQPSNSRDDPIRSIFLNNSALANDNLTVFTAQFGNLRLTESGDATFNFSDLTASDLGVRTLLDYTERVRSIINNISSTPPTTDGQCCGYQYQILDQYCASRPFTTIMSTCRDRENFGYNDFDQRCLSCCNSTVTGNYLLSCTNPIYNYLSGLNPPFNSGQFCPSPPKLSYTAASATSPSGPLESENVYIAELLLRVATDLTTDVFFRRFQAGFSLTMREPRHSVCGCIQPDDVCDGSPYFFALNTGVDNGTDAMNNITRYSFNQICAGAWSLFALNQDCVNTTRLINIIPGCSELEFMEGDMLECNTSTSPLPQTYQVDGLASNLLQFGACGNLSSCGRGPRMVPSSLDPACSMDKRTVAAVYPDQTTEIAATVWYNNQPYHMPAAALNSFHNVLLKKLSPNQRFSISVNNHPLPRNLTVQTQQAQNDPTGFGVGTLVVFGWSFLLASFVIFLVQEKESKAKHIQYVSGVHTSSYWLSTFAWDLLNSLGPIVASVILFAAFQVDAYSSVEALGAIFLLLFLTSWAGIPVSYLFSFMFSNALAAYSILMIFFFFSALLLLTVVFVVTITEPDSNTPDILHYIFLIFPTYGLSVGFNDLFTNENIRSVCERNREFCAGNSGLNFVDNPLDIERPGIGLIYIYLFFEGIIFFTLVILIEERFFVSKICGMLGNGKNNYVASSEPLLAGEDDDVHAEKKRVLSEATDESDVVIVKNLVKIYSGHLSGCSWKPAKPAVRGISLGIPGGECFGLLGVNGAGKTTTFNILTGDISMTSGTGVIAGYDIRTNLRDVQQRIGYCPQFDALIERLTGRELLTMFARLRGIPEKQIKEVVDIEITRLDLKKHAHKKCGTYSGGNKRKLSTAIALVGNPPIVLLDEPTTGMDPTTRRYLWDVLTGIVQEGRSIVLTSHSMEECEALCTRLAIMVNGSFKCLGSIQHLKNKFGSGLSLQAKVKMSPPPEEPVLTRSGSRRERLSFRRSSSRRNRQRSTSEEPSSTSVVPNASIPEASVVENPSTLNVARQTSVGLNGGLGSPARSVFDPYDTTSLHIFIREAFPGAVLLEEHQGAVTYRLPTNAMSWSSVFRQLETNKERLGIVDYSVSQTTLEQVFINFAKEQFDE